MAYKMYLKPLPPGEMLGPGPRIGGSDTTMDSVGRDSVDAASPKVTRCSRQQLREWLQSQLPPSARAPKALQEWLAEHGQELLLHGRGAIQAACFCGLAEVVLPWLVQRIDNAFRNRGKLVRAAAMGGHIPVLEWLEDSGVAASEGGRWAARAASEQGHIQTLDWLDKHGLDIITHGGTAVRGACAGGHIKVLDWLVMRGVMLEEKCCGWSIRLAAEGGHLEVLQSLKQQKIDVLGFCGAAVCGAAHGGHVNVLDWLVKAGDLKSVVQHGKQATWAAAEGGNVGVLNWLSNQGVNVKEAGGIAIWSAAKGGHLDVLEWLVKHKVEPKEGGTAALSAAAAVGREVLQWLAANGLDAAESGDRAVWLAAKRGDLEALQWLDTAGLDLREHSRTVVSGAARSGSLRILEWFCEREGVELSAFAHDAYRWAAAGANIDILNWLADRKKLSPVEGGWVAMESAAASGHAGILQWLISRGLDLKSNGGAAVVGASRGGCIEILQFLVANNVELGQHAEEAIQEAAAYGHLDVLQWFAQHGFPVTLGGDAVLRRAAVGGHLETLEWATQQGFDLAENWRAVHWGASEAAQLDVLNWLDFMYPPVWRGDMRKGTTSRSFSGRQVQSLEKSKSKITDVVNEIGSGSGLKWMLMNQLDQDEGIFDWLQRTAAAGSFEILHWLSMVMSKGSRRRGHWALRMAVKGGHLEVVQWLARTGVNLKEHAEDVVRWAAEESHLHILRWLRAGGLRLGQEVIEAASSCGTAELLEVLRDFELPLAQYPTLAAKLAPAVHSVNEVMLTNFLGVRDSDAVAQILDTSLEAKTVRDHKGSAVCRAVMSSFMKAYAFERDPQDADGLQPVAPSRRTLFNRGEDTAVKVAKVAVPGVTSPAVLYALATTPCDSVFHSVVAQAVVSAAWRKVLPIYALDVAIDLLRLAAVWHLTSRAKAYDDDAGVASERLSDVTTAWSYYVILVTWLYSFVHECQQAKSFLFDHRAWCSSYFTPKEAWDWVTLLAFATLLVIALVDPQSDAVMSLLSFVGFSSWWRLLIALRGFDYFGPRILPIVSAFKEVLPFIIVIVFYGGAFLHAFYALSGFTLEDMFIPFYRLTMLADLEVADDVLGEGWSALQLVWFVLATFFFTVALMNIFIGIMTSAFDRREEMAETAFLRMRAGICLSYALSHDSFPCLRPFASPYEQVWVAYQALPKEDCQEIRSLRHALTTKLTSLREDLSDELREHRTKMSAEIRQLRHAVQCANSARIA